MGVATLRRDLAQKNVGDSVDSNSAEVTFELHAQAEQDLSLEKWSLMNCSSTIRETYGLEMKVIIC